MPVLRISPDSHGRMRFRVEPALLTITAKARRRRGPTMVRRAAASRMVSDSDSPHSTRAPAQPTEPSAVPMVDQPMRPSNQNRAAMAAATDTSWMSFFTFMTGAPGPSRRGSASNRATRPGANRRRGRRGLGSGRPRDRPRPRGRSRSAQARCERRRHARPRGH